jgi:hypothetical protein
MSPTAKSVPFPRHRHLSAVSVTPWTMVLAGFGSYFRLWSINLFLHHLLADLLGGGECEQGIYWLSGWWGGALLACKISYRKWCVCSSRTKHKGRLLVGITSMISCIAQTTLHLQLRSATNEWARSSCSLLVEGTRQIKQAVSNTNTNSLSMIRDHPGPG